MAGEILTRAKGSRARTETVHVKSILDEAVAVERASGRVRAWAASENGSAEDSGSHLEGSSGESRPLTLT